MLKHCVSLKFHSSPIAKHSCVRGPGTHVWIATGSHDALRIPTSTSFEWHIRRCVSNASSPLDVITNEIKARRRSIVILIYLRIMIKNIWSRKWCWNKEQITHTIFIYVIQYILSQSNKCFFLLLFWTYYYRLTVSKH